MCFFLFLVSLLCVTCIGPHKVWLHLWLGQRCQGAGRPHRTLHPLPPTQEGLAAPPTPSAAGPRVGSGCAALWTRLSPAQVVHNQLPEPSVPTSLPSPGSRGWRTPCRSPELGFARGRGHGVPQSLFSNPLHTPPLLPQVRKGPSSPLPSMLSTWHLGLSWVASPHFYSRVA